MEQQTLFAVHAPQLLKVALTTGLLPPFDIEGVRIMKKWFCVLLALFLIMLNGCSRGVEVLSNDQYCIMEKDGQYYMELHKPVSSSPGNTLEGTAQAPYIIQFSSLKELKNAITEGKFTEKQLAHMQENFPRNKSGNVLLCNVNKLYNAAVPEGVEVETIHWYGDRYRFVFDKDGWIDFSVREAYDKFALGYDIESGTAKIISVNMISDRNAKEVVFEDLLGAPRKMVTYSYKSEEKTITIAEQYNLDESETVPFSINFWGTCDGAYFTGNMYGFTERPSYEWVTSFGLKPYAETETE